MLTIEMLPAYEGDSLWIEYGDRAKPGRICIDAGRKETYRTLAERIQPLDRPLELFCLTHVDDDHIFGAVPLFADARITPARFGDIWYNGYTHLDRAIASKPQRDVLGPLNGEIFAGLLLDRGFPWNETWNGATVVVPDGGALPKISLPGGMVLTLLSPTWAALDALKAFWERELEEMEPRDAEAALEIFSDKRSLQPDVLGGIVDVDDLVDRPYQGDTKEPNGSSIAFLAEYDGKAVLLAADAHPSVLEKSIERLLRDRGQSRLCLDAYKLSHHGSKANTSPRLLDLVDCRRYLISTNGSRHQHPDQEAIARVLYRNHAETEATELYFNYRTKHNEVWDDDGLRDDWDYVTFYPPAGTRIEL